MTGLVTLVILSVLRGQQRGANPDTKGVARLLAGQKDQIVRAMPTGLFDALAKDGVYEGIASTATPELRITYDASRAAYDQPSKRRIVDEIGSADWPYWALGVLLFGGLLWSLLPMPTKPSSGSTPLSPVLSPGASRQMPSTSLSISGAHSTTGCPWHNPPMPTSVKSFTVGQAKGSAPSKMS